VKLLGQDLDALSRNDLTVLLSAIGARRRELAAELQQPVTRSVTRADVARKLRRADAGDEYNALGREVAAVQTRLSVVRRLEAERQSYTFERKFIEAARNTLDPDVYADLVEAAREAVRHECPA
jgi:hypothetical protein